jgi:FOG: FHA domain
MGELRTENMGSETYLVYTVGMSEVVDELSLGMLSNNKIPNLLVSSNYMKDGERIIRYHISSKVSLESYLSGIISRRNLLTVFKTITGAFLSSEEYMLEPVQILLGLSNIYINVSTAEAYLICLPLETVNSEVDMVKFFKEILFSSRFETGENGDYILELSNYLNSESTFSILGFNKLISKLLGGEIKNESILPSSSSSISRAETQISSSPIMSSVKPQVKQPEVPIESRKRGEKKGLFGLGKSKSNVNEKVDSPAPQLSLYSQKQDTIANIGGKGFLVPGVETPVTMNTISGVGSTKTDKKSEKVRKEKTTKKPLFSFGKKAEEKIIEVPAEKPQVFPSYSKPEASIGETTVLGIENANIGETTVLGVEATQNIFAYLMRKNTNEKITISKSKFKLGKEPSYVDYCIKENSAISRSHADIITEGSKYFVIDNNSLNHTFVNGVQLAPQQQVEIENGDIIILADEEFVFNR